MELEPPPTEPTKRCPNCRSVKAVGEFPKNRASKDGLATYCKPCHNQRMKEISDRLYGGHKNYLLLRRYGIDEVGVMALLQQQGGRCAICGLEGPTHVDHGHRTGVIRGVLCFSCNRGLGKARDEVLVLKLCTDYLRKPPL